MKRAKNIFSIKILAPHFLCVFFLGFFLSCFCPPFLEAALGPRGAVTTSDPRATRTALEILEQGGNAIDAAVAAQWMLQVTQPQVSGLGGSGYLLFYDAGTKRILFFDGSVKAPKGVSAEMFFDENGNLRPLQPDRNTGGLPVGVPGLLALLEEVQSRYGTRKFPFAKLFAPAIQAAEAGVEVSETLAQAIREHQGRLELFETPRALFLKEGQPLRTGEKILQPDLSKTFRLIQKQGIAAFYKKQIADAILREVRKNTYRPGFLKARDLANYQMAKREPLHGTYLGYDLFTMSPPATGGIMLLRGLNILSRFGMTGFGSSAETYHLLDDVQALAFSERTAIGDPDIFEVPLEKLLSESWAQEAGESIQLDKASKKSASISGKSTSVVFSSIIAIDPQGNVVILSTTLGDVFGSAVMVPGYGFFLNNQLVDFDAGPEDIKTEDTVNVPFPGQRPRSPIASTIVFGEGRFLMALNGYGAEDPAAVLLNLMVSKLDLGASCEETLKAPRIVDHGGVMREEPGLYNHEVMRVKLELMGHRIEVKDKIGNAQIVCFDNSSGKIAALDDPRNSVSVLKDSGPESE